MDVLLEILSANTPVPSTPKRHPSSSTAAANDVQFFFFPACVE